MAQLQHAAVRLEADTVAKVDALIPSFSKPWREANRSDVLRVLIGEALAARDRAAKRKARARAPEAVKSDGKRQQRRR